MWPPLSEGPDFISGPYKAGFLAQRRFLMSYVAPASGDSRCGVWLRIANPTPHSQWDRPAGSGLAGPCDRVVGFQAREVTIRSDMQNC